jgi:hypothetical protein
MKRQFLVRVEIVAEDPHTVVERLTPELIQLTHMLAERGGVALSMTVGEIAQLEQKEPERK